MSHFYDVNCDDESMQNPITFESKKRKKEKKKFQYNGIVNYH